MEVDMKKSVLNQNGSTLLIALLIMLMLTLVFTAAVTTSVTDLDIAKNQKERTLAFYTAEAGVQLALGVLRTNFNELNNDTLEKYINIDSCLGEGTFTVDVSGTSPFKILSSTGCSRDGKATIEVTVRRKRTPLCIWDNIIFAGTGDAGGGGIVSGNANLHGSVHLLGENQGPEDIVIDIDGDVGIYNNYTNINATLSSRLPALDTVTFNGEVVSTLNSELRVKHGMVNVGASSSVGYPNVSGGWPLIKETLDGTYVTDGFGGTQGESGVYSDNGTIEHYDLGDQLALPGLYDPYTDPNTGTTYPTYMNYLSNNALVISGDLTLKPGDAVAPISNGFGSISLDVNGNLQISGIVYVTGDVQVRCGAGLNEVDPVIFDGKGTLVSEGYIYIDTHLLSKGTFATDDILGFISANDIDLGAGPGAANLNIMGVFFAQNELLNEKQNQLAGAMASNYFKINQVPDLFQVPAVVDNLPPGMPGSETIDIYTYEVVNGTWREY
jgi:hypothetical protein